LTTLQETIIIIR